MIRRLLAALAAAIALAVLPSTPAGATSPLDYGYRDWNRSGCTIVVWWRYKNIYDTTTGRTWAGAEYWKDYGYWGYEVNPSYGPIRDEYARRGWECGSLSWTETVVYQRTDLYSARGPVFEQDFQRGFILFYSNNLCRCYAEGGSFYVGYW